MRDERTIKLLGLKMADIEPQEIMNTADVIAKVAPVIVGGVLAIFSGGVGAWFTQKFIFQKESKLHKLKKIEELLDYATQCEQWLDDYKTSRIGDELTQVGQSPIEKVKYLGALYAPDLKICILKLSAAHASYVELVASCHLEKIKTGNVPSRFLEEYQSKYIAVTSSVSELVEEAVVIIEKVSP